MEKSMNLKILICIFLTLLVSTQTAYATENEYGIVKAWFNEKNATVEGFNLKIGEPGEIKIEVESKIDGDAIIQLYEPGVTKAFKVINGPSEIEKRIDNLNIVSGWTKTYTWTIAPTGAWKNGNAPINVFVQFYKGMKDKKVDFTIANPYILDEQYSGSTPARTTGAAQPSPTGTSSETQQAPFLSALAALVVILGIWTIQKKTNRR
jgi:sarcinarray family protein